MRIKKYIITVCVFIYIGMMLFTFSYAGHIEAKRLQAVYDKMPASEAENTACVYGAFVGMIWPLYWPLHLAWKWGETS